MEGDYPFGKVAGNMKTIALILVLAMAMQTPAWGATEGETPSTGAPPATEKTVSMKFNGADRAPAPYEPVKTLIVFKTTVAGREVWGLLDTGADRSLVDLDLARAAGLKFGAKGEITTPTNKMEAWLVSDVPVIILGQFTVTVPVLPAIDMKPISSQLGRKIEFILGNDFFKSLVVTVDPGRRLLQFGPSGAIKPPESFPSVSLTDSGRLFEVTIGGKPVKVGIDTGSSGALTLSPEAWARVGPSDAPLKTRGTMSAEGEAYMADFAQVPEIAIGPIKRRNVSVSIRPWPAKDGDGVIGMGLLDQTLFVLDRRAGKLWLVPRLPSAVDASRPAPADAAK